MMTLIKPSKIKLAFVLPWLLYLALELILGHNILLPVAGLTLLFLYGLGGLAEVLAERSGQLAGCKSLLIGAVMLAGTDHLGKLAVQNYLPMGSQVTLVPGSFYLQQIHNMQAAWLPNKFGFELPLLFLSIMAVFIMVTSVVVYNYYTGVHQRTVYTNLALVLMFAGAFSAFGDQVLRGFTVDFIGFDGFFIADLKDIYLTLGVASVVAEAMISPAEDPAFRELPALIVRMLRYNLKPRQNL
jgi:lipoprotein signal peptidase